MALRFYNTASQKKEVFQPLEPGKVSLYACGPTVYDFFHIGNARAFVVFDTLRRFLEHREFKVNFIQNITDVDDKIITRANREGITAEAVARKYTEAFLEDVLALGCLPATQYPKATEHMPEIIELVQRIIGKGHAYEAGGDVFFAVRSFLGYGKLSGKKIDELEEGARVEVDLKKKDPLDFALWKAAKPGEPAWDSPWGKGRPGWHIECSAMSMKYLGDQFDIHGGGEDLVFPHHENENAQSESVTGKMLARFWLHNGHLKIDGEKMSKSLGNFWVTRDVLKEFDWRIVRMFLLSAHYRSPLDFKKENLEAINKAYQEIRQMLEDISDNLDHRQDAALGEDREAEELLRLAEMGFQQFQESLADDFNTSGAFGQIFILARKMRDAVAKRRKMTARMIAVLVQTSKLIKEMFGILGIEVKINEKTLEIKAAIRQLDQARKDKNYAESDRLRSELKIQGWVVKNVGDWSCASLEVSIALDPMPDKESETK